MAIERRSQRDPSEWQNGEVQELEIKELYAANSACCGFVHQTRTYF